MERNQIKSSEEEIDLVYYFGKFREGLNKVGLWLLRYLRILWKNFLVFLLIILIGTGAAFSLRYIISPTYRTNGLFVSRYLSAKYYQLMVQDLNQLLGKKNSPTVCEQLNLSPEQAAHLVHMELSPIRDTMLERTDTIFPFEVTLQLQDMNGLARIQDGLLSYLEGGRKETEGKLNKIEVVQPFLKRFDYNYPDYNKYLLYGFFASVFLAILATPVIGKRK